MRLSAVSLDMGGAYKLATDNKAPHAVQCVDPFHLVKRPMTPWTRPVGKSGTSLLDRSKAPWWKHTRWALLKDGCSGIGVGDFGERQFGLIPM